MGSSGFSDRELTEVQATELMARSELMEAITASILRKRDREGYYASTSTLCDAMLEPLSRYTNAVFRKKAAILLRTFESLQELDAFSNRLDCCVDETLDQVCQPAGVYRETVKHALQRAGAWVEPEQEYVILGDGTSKAYRTLPIRPSELLRWNFRERLKLTLHSSALYFRGAALKKAEKTATGAAEAAGNDGAPGTRAEWLDERLRERGWSKGDLALHNGPDRKTVERILRGERVGNAVLTKLAAALSFRPHPTVNVLDIPRD